MLVGDADGLDLGGIEPASAMRRRVSRADRPHRSAGLSSGFRRGCSCRSCRRRARRRGVGGRGEHGGGGKIQYPIFSIQYPTTREQPNPEVFHSVENLLKQDRQFFHGVENPESFFPWRGKRGAWVQEGCLGGGGSPRVRRRGRFPRAGGGGLAALEEFAASWR